MIALRLVPFRLCAAMLVGACLAVHTPGQVDGTAARPSFLLETSSGDINVASPVVAADGTVYVGTRTTILGAERGRLFAISANGTYRSFLAGDWIDGTPAIGADGTVYVGCWDGKLYALRDTGTAITALWEYNAGGFVNCSPAIGRDGTLYFGAGDSSLHAIRPDGGLKWRAPLPYWVDSSPAIAPNGQIIVGCWDGAIYAIDVDGERQWSFATGDVILSSPAIAADGTIYVGSNDNALYALNPDGTLRWSYLTGGDIESSPAISADGTVYFGSNDGVLYAVRADGSLRWRIALGASIASSPAVRADGSVVVGGAAFSGAPQPGFMAAVNADGTLKWRFAADDIVDSSPAIGADQRIYFTSYGRRLYTLNGSAGLAGNAPWPKFRRNGLHHGRTIADPSQGRLLNLSSRALVGAGEGILVAGFVIAGGSKTMLVRAIGPELGAFNVPGVVARPTLSVVPAGGAPVLASNTGWGSVPSEVPVLRAAFAQVGAFPLTTGSADCAAVVPLTAGAYTPQVSGIGGTTGVALVELYDLTTGTGGRLVNLSTRARVGTGSDLLIAGMYLAGPAPRTVLIRGIGPTLGSFGIGSPLALPILTLFSSDGPMETNTGWGNAANAGLIKSVGTEVGAFALANNSRDTAILVTLSPGAYTVHLSGANATSGIGLIEVYEVL